MPAAHGRHAAAEVALKFALKVPAAQLEHDEAPSALYVPAGQGEQTALPRVLKVPAAHAEQEAAPSAKVPAGQEDAV